LAKQNAKKGGGAYKEGEAKKKLPELESNSSRFSEDLEQAEEIVIALDFDVTAAEELEKLILQIKPIERPSDSVSSSVKVSRLYERLTNLSKVEGREHDQSLDCLPPWYHHFQGQAEQLQRDILPKESFASLRKVKKECTVQHAYGEDDSLDELI